MWFSYAFVAFLALTVVGAAFYGGRALWRWRAPLGPATVVAIAAAVVAGGTHLWLTGNQKFVDLGQFHYCIFNDGTTFFSASPCRDGKPAANYVQWTHWGIAGGGFVIVADTCGARPVLKTWWDPADYQADNRDGNFELVHTTFRDLKPDPTCHIAIISRRHPRDVLVRRYGAEWGEVRTVR